MMRKFSTFLYKISNTWVMLFTLAVMILTMVFILPGQAESADASYSSSGSPDTTFFYLPDQLYSWAADYGEDGRQSYIQSRWTFDLIFPMVYTSFLATGISWLASRVSNLSEKLNVLNLLPIAGGLLDYLENSSASLLMGLYPSQIPGLAILTAIFSACKWIFINLAFLAYFALLAALLFQRIKRDRS